MTNISKHDVGREPTDQSRELTSDELEQVSGGSSAAAKDQGKTFLTFKFGTVFTTKTDWGHDD
jgi:hypothetical protein